MTRFPFLFLVCCSALFSTGKVASGKEVLLRFASFGLPADGGEYVVAAGESQSSPFAVPDNGFSEPVAAPGAAFGLGKAGEQPFKSLAAIRLPEAGKHFLVIVLPGKDADTLRTLVVRADDPTFRPGEVMILNLARETLAADLGGQKLRFEPGSQTIFRPRRKDDLANYQVRFFQEKEGRAKMFAANLWPYFDHKRAFVFLHTDPATGSPTYRSIDEFTDWLRDGAGEPDS